MSNYAVEMIMVATPNGAIVPFFTSRPDQRADAILAKEVPRYFRENRKLGEGYYFVSRVFMTKDMSKQDAELFLSKQLAVYETSGLATLNAKHAPGKNRPAIQLMAA